ncbi:MAG: stage III sporulation protein AD [Bacillota bacterium]|nr:stage III sporulation protein AD [Bacillota bacterium]
MELVQVVGFALVVTVILVVLRQQRPDMAVMLSLAAAAAILFFLVDRIWQAIDLLQELAARAGVRDTYVQILLRVMGIAYLAELGSQVCRDAGEGAMATKVEMAGKIIILILAIPIVRALADAILAAIPLASR